MKPDGVPLSGWRARGHEIIFESDTPEGKAFDVVLILAILCSVAAVTLETVEAIETRYGAALTTIEWIFTILFTLEYALRLLCVARPARYARSFFGAVDVLSIVPTYVSVLIPGTQALAVIRGLRLLRIFRVLKLGHYVAESETLMRALAASRRKIAVFIFTVLTLVVIFGSLMYLIEGEQQDSSFTSIPRGIYWAIVTLTTVGYGNISPTTELGQAVAAFIMILGYGIIAVPTGIVTAELTHAGAQKLVSGQACRACSAEGHRPDAVFCRICGARL